MSGSAGAGIPTATFTGSKQRGLSRLQLPPRHCACSTIRRAARSHGDRLGQQACSRSSDKRVPAEIMRDRWGQDGMHRKRRAPRYTLAAMRQSCRYPSHAVSSATPAPAQRAPGPQGGQALSRWHAARLWRYSYLRLPANAKKSGASARTSIWKSPSHAFASSCTGRSPRLTPAAFAS